MGDVRRGVVSPRRYFVVEVARGMIAGLLVAFAVAATAQDDRAEALKVVFEPSVMAPKAARSMLLDAATLGDVAYAVGERGHIMKSTDAGHHWQQQRVPVRTTLTAVCFADEKLGWAVGHDAVILRTDDGGDNWKMIFNAPEREQPLLDVWFRDSTHGLAVGAYGLMLFTEDGGDQWMEVVVSSGAIAEGEPDDFHLNHVAASPGGDLFLAAEAGMVSRSSDSGQSWVALDSPYEGSYFGALSLSKGELLIFGLRGHLFRSEDSGNRWEEVKTGTQALLNDAIQLVDGTIVVVGMEGVVLVSHDQGRSFKLHRQEGRKGYSAVIQTGDQSVILVGEGGFHRLDKAVYSAPPGS